MRPVFSILSLFLLLLTACAGGGGSSASGYTLVQSGTGPITKTRNKAVLAVGWRTDEHGPWRLKKLLVDGHVAGAWLRENQVPGVVTINPGVREVAIVTSRGRGEIKSATQRFLINAGGVAVCPVDVARGDTSPSLACGERSAESVALTPAPQPAPVASAAPPPRQRQSDPPPRRDPPPPRKQQVEPAPPPPPPPPPPPDRGLAKIGRVEHLSGGEVNERSIKRRFSKSKSEILECYSSQVRAGNLAKGKVKLSFTVWDDGCAAEINARAQKGLQDTASCILGIMRGFCFGEPDGGRGQYRVSFYFEPVRGKSR